MIINPNIKKIFIEIHNQAIHFANTPDQERKYLKRFLDIYKNKLTEEEQLYLFKLIIESLHYKSIVTDPDTVLQLHNIKLRTYTYIMLLAIVVILVIASIFKVNDSFEHITTLMSNIFKILTF